MLLNSMLLVWWKEVDRFADLLCLDRLDELIEILEKGFEGKASQG